MPSENKTIFVQFANGVTIPIFKMDSTVFSQLQEKYKSAITQINGQHPTEWDPVIKHNLEHLKVFQDNCQHNKGVITNLAGGSRCCICGKLVS